MSPRFLAGLALLLALGACGSDDVTGPGPGGLSTPPPPFTGAVAGSYDLMIVPAAACRFPASSYRYAMVAQQTGQTGSPGTANLRATLANGDYNLALDMQLPSPGIVRGSISTQQAAVISGELAVFLRNIGTGTVTAAAGGRGEVRDGTMIGVVEVYVDDASLGQCMSSDHRWMLLAR